MFDAAVFAILFKLALIQLPAVPCLVLTLIAAFLSLNTKYVPAFTVVFGFLLFNASSAVVNPLNFVTTLYVFAFDVEVEAAALGCGVTVAVDAGKL